MTYSIQYMYYGLSSSVYTAHNSVFPEKLTVLIDGEYDYRKEEWNVLFNVCKMYDLH